MNELINTTYELTWRAAIIVKVGDGIADTVRGPEQALNCLTYRWPVSEGNHFNSGRLMCMRALQKQACCEEAREAFISAAIEARMLA